MKLQVRYSKILEGRLKKLKRNTVEGNLKIKNFILHVQNKLF